jgi:hypothetical protein
VDSVLLPVNKSDKGDNRKEFRGTLRLCKVSIAAASQTRQGDTSNSKGDGSNSEEPSRGDFIGIVQSSKVCCDGYQRCDDVIERCEDQERPKNLLCPE